MLRAGEAGREAGADEPQLCPGESMGHRSAESAPACRGGAGGTSQNSLDRVGWERGHVRRGHGGSKPAHEGAVTTPRNPGEATGALEIKTIKSSSLLFLDRKQNSGHKHKLSWRLFSKGDANQTGSAARKDPPRKGITRGSIRGPRRKSRLQAGYHTSLRTCGI